LHYWCGGAVWDLNLRNLPCTNDDLAA